MKQIYFTSFCNWAIKLYFNNSFIKAYHIFSCTEGHMNRMSLQLGKLKIDMILTKWPDL